MSTLIASKTSIGEPVHCDSCEAVCCRMVVVVLPEDRVPDWLLDYDEHGFQTLAKNEEGWCVAIDPASFRCTIYDERPSICRSFAMGSPSCREERDLWFGRHGPANPDAPDPVI